MDNYVDFAKKLAHQAGDIMLEHFKMGVAGEIKSDETPVTIADTSINRLVIDEVSRHFPAHSVIGEEESAGAPKTEYVWVCDPIDGTIPYTLGIPTNLFSLALVQDGKVILGILYDPYMKRLFEASHTKGAYLNGKRISVSRQQTPQGYVALPAMRYGLLRTADLLQDAVTAGMRALSLCSVTYESSLVASGQMTGVIFPGQGPWDIAAVKVIVEEAGGKVTDLHGNEQRYDMSIQGAVISNNTMHDAFVALANRHMTAK